MNAATVAGVVMMLALTGASQPPAVSPPATPPATDQQPAPPDVMLTGTRTISYTRGSWPTATTETTVYPVVEHDTGLAKRQLAFGPPDTIRTDGLQPLAETATAAFAFVSGAPVETSSTISTTRRWLGVERPQPIVDDETVTTTGIDGLAETEHVVAIGPQDRGAPFEYVDYTRTTKADGSYVARGRRGASDRFALTVGPDFHAILHSGGSDGPSFDLDTGPLGTDEVRASMRMVLGSDPRDTPVAVGDTYRVPSWFPPQPSPTLVEHVVTPNAAPSADCKSAVQTGPLLLVHHRRRQVDPSEGVRESTADTYYDTRYAAVCRISTESDAQYSLSTGALTSTNTERTVVARGT